MVDRVSVIRQSAAERAEWATRVFEYPESSPSQRDEAREIIAAVAAEADTTQGAVSANDDAFQVICDALSALHPPQARELMETPSYKAFAAFYKRGQSPGGQSETGPDADEHEETP